MLDVKRLARHTSEKRKRGDTEYIKIDPTNAEDLKRLPKDMVDEQRPFREGDLIGVCSCGFVSWHLKGPGSFKTAKYKALNMHANAEIPEVCTSVEMADAEDECTSKEPERYELVEYNEMKRKYVELEKEKEMVEQKLARTEELCRVQGQVLFGIYRFLINRLSPACRTCHSTVDYTTNRHALVAVVGHIGFGACLGLCGTAPL